MSEKQLSLNVICDMEGGGEGMSGKCQKMSRNI
jgi:hypothetical protein